MSRRALTAAFVVLLAATAASAGVTYTAVTNAEGRGSEQMNQTMKVWANDNGMKAEFTESNNPMMGEGTYLLTSDAGKTFYLVNPKDKTYSQWNMEGMMQFAGGVTKMMNMKFSNPKVEKLGEEPGPAIAGLPTTHYTFRTSYTMEMSFMGMHQASTIVKTEQIWAAPKLVDAVLFAWMRKSAPKFGNEEFDKLVQAEMETVKGFPLKRVAETVTTDKNGRSQTSRMTMEVKDLQMTLVPDSTFALPAGYKETQLVPAGEEGEGKGGENPLAKMFGGKSKS